jgi:hypothetical protein
VLHNEDYGKSTLQITQTTLFYLVLKLQQLMLCDEGLKRFTETKGYQDVEDSDRTLLQGA